MTKKIIIGLILFLVFLIIFLLIITNLVKNKKGTAQNFFYPEKSTELTKRSKVNNPTSIVQSNAFKKTENNKEDNKNNSFIEKIKSFMVDNDDFSIVYSSSLNKFIITKKSASADAAIRKWFVEHDLEDYINSDLFIYDVLPSNAYQKNLINNNDNSYLNNQDKNNIATTPSPMIIDKNLTLFIDFLKAFSTFSNVTISANLDSYLTPSPEPTISDLPNDNNGSTYDSLGLPEPKSDGINGYNALKNKLESNSNALWAAKQLLEGEKTYINKGGTLIKYLTTAWVWFENGASSWPDPYEVNCNDDRTGYSSEVSFFCNSSNFQVGGYQAASRKSDYIQVFNRLYSDSDLKSVLQNVIDNSYRASKSKWNYKDSGQNKDLITKYLAGKSIPPSLTLNDISPNGNFFDEKAQFFTLILGKDPKMAVALNSYAVNSGFLNQLKNANDSKKLYGYIGNREVQLISNMIAALYMIDTGSLPSSGGFSGGGNIVAWANQISNNLTAGQICDGWNCRQTNSISNGSYSAAIRQGYDNSLATSGRYWCTQLPIDSYNLAGKKGLNNSHAGIVGMIQFWKNTSGYKYLDYSGGSSRQQILNQLQPGCAMFQESKHGVHTGYEHAAIIKDVSIKNGDGYIITYDANGPQKTSRYIIDNWQVINNFYSYVSFGC